MIVASRRPKVTLDIGPLFDDQWTGIPVFTRRLAQSLLRHEAVDVEFVFNLTTIPRSKVVAAIHAGTGTFLREDYERTGAEGYGTISPDSHLLFPSVKSVFGVGKIEASTIHDMSTLFMPENHVEANVAYHLDHFAKEVASDDVVFCVSEATRQVVMSAFPSIAKKARTLYQFADWPEEFAALEQNMPPLALGRYAIVVGTVEPRKNLALLIRALALPEIERSKLKFIVIGKKGWLVDSFLAGLTQEQRERIVFSGFVSEFAKYRLIKSAEFMVFPSIYEGFGIPALEAMSLGKPVLASRTSSFPEVIGDAGVYFDPFSVADFAGALAEIESKKKLAELAPKALAQNATFGWQRMAEPVVKWASEA